MHGWCATRGDRSKPRIAAAVRSALQALAKQLAAHKHARTHTSARMWYAHTYLHMCASLHKRAATKKKHCVAWDGCGVQATLDFFSENEGSTEFAGLQPP